MDAVRAQILINGLEREKEITVQSGYYEDGEFILEHCNHAGAALDRIDVSSMDFWPDGGIYLPDGSKTIVTMVCDKKNCRKYLDNGEWIN